MSATYNTEPVALISLNAEIGVLIILVGILLVLFVRRRRTDLSKDTLLAESEDTPTDLSRPALVDVFPRINFPAHREPHALSETEAFCHHTPPNLPVNNPPGFHISIPPDLPADIPPALIPGGAWRPYRMEH
jgi:hypothetical protein